MPEKRTGRFVNVLNKIYWNNEVETILKSCEVLLCWFKLNFNTDDGQDCFVFSFFGFLRGGGGGGRNGGMCAVLES